jgi:hypothetical protein
MLCIISKFSLGNIDIKFNHYFEVVNACPFSFVKLTVVVNKMPFYKMYGSPCLRNVVPSSGDQPHLDKIVLLSTLPT